MTVALPPQADGAPVLLLLNDPLHPPLALAVASHALKAASTADCVWHDATVVLAGQVIDTVGGAGTVNVALQVWATPQLLV